ncbi:hypothetical protein RI054_12g61450 [Pseudoscourfieldia marina]
MTTSKNATSSSSALARNDNDDNSEGGGVFPTLGVSTRWLLKFAKSHKEKAFTWTATDYLKEESPYSSSLSPRELSLGPRGRWTYTVLDEGGGDKTLLVTVDNLLEHRKHISAAGKDGDGKPTTVKYVDIPFEQMTTNDVCFAIVKLATESKKCSYAEMLQAEMPDAVKPATVFISHAWKYSFLDVVISVSYNELKGDSEGDCEYAWFDIFTVNQHASLNVPPDWWFTTFKNAVARIGRTWVIILKDATGEGAFLSNQIVLRRAWCVWEMFSTIAGGSKLVLKFPGFGDHGRNLYSTKGWYSSGRMNSDANLIQEVFDMHDGHGYAAKCGIPEEDRIVVNVMGAEALKKEDRDNILNAVKEYPGGSAEINNMIKKEIVEHSNSTYQACQFMFYN